MNLDARKIEDQLVRKLYSKILIRFIWSNVMFTPLEKIYSFEYLETLHYTKLEKIAKEVSINNQEKYQGYLIGIATEVVFNLEEFKDIVPNFVKTEVIDNIFYLFGIEDD